MQSILPAYISAILKVLQTQGGQPIMVGGCVRNYLLGLEILDYDIEVYHLSPAQIHQALEPFGPIKEVGISFGVFKIPGLNVDISLPRRDNKRGPGHRAFDIDIVPNLSFLEAAKRRDLTINSIGFDIFAPPGQQWLDPYEGRHDLRHKILKATDPIHFVEDPLRGLRVAQFTARFAMQPDPLLITLCQGLGLDELPGERIFTEITKMLQAPHPSLGLQFLKHSTLSRFIPGLDVLAKGPIDPWKNLLKAIDKAALIHELGVSLSVLSFYFPQEKMISNFLKWIHAPKKLSQHVILLIPLLRNFSKMILTDPVLRKLARSLARQEMSLHRFFKITEIIFPELFRPCLLEHCTELGIAEAPLPLVVQGHHLQALGIEPGPGMGDLLRKCQEHQDLYGLTEIKTIIDAVLGTEEAPK